MTTLFISDLHLCEQAPDTTRAFLEFLTGKAPRANALYILGDLFEYWAGDDDESPLAAAIAEALAHLRDAGTACYFVAGNRDFLLGERFATRARLIRLPDPVIEVIDGQRLLLSHGDSWCTDDIAYQRFRDQVRDPAWQATFLQQPLAQRKAIIDAIRQQSEHAKQEKELAIMDVNPEAVAATFRAHDYPIMIHGHTHRPAHHELLVDGHPCQRWVLADWHGAATYLEFANGQFRATGCPPREAGTGTPT